MKYSDSRAQSIGESAERVYPAEEKSFQSRARVAEGEAAVRRSTDPSAHRSSHRSRAAIMKCMKTHLRVRPTYDKFSWEYFFFKRFQKNSGNNVNNEVQINLSTRISSSK